MKNYYAILKGRTVVPVDSIYEMTPMFEPGVNNRIVKKDMIGKVQVSTVFLAINHGFTGNRPLWFETMIFGGKHDGFQRRYETYDEAEAGHKEAVKLVEGKEDDCEI